MSEVDATLLQRLLRQWASTLALLILTLSRMALSKVSFSDILGNDFWDHHDTLDKIWIFTLSKITL